jgi:UDP-glucose 4-epimerase
MHTTLVTGGAGFIGSHLVEALLARGQRVTVLDDLSTGALANLASVQSHPRLRVVVGSITNERLVTKLLDTADDVYHLAAVVGVRLVLEEPARTTATNLNATESLLRHAVSRDLPVFLASTSEVYGRSHKSPLSEDDDLALGAPSGGRWVYALGKALGEALALGHHRQTGLPVVVGRFFNVVGPRQIGRYGMVLPRFVSAALAGRPLQVHGDGQQVRCFAHVADVVRGVINLMDCPAVRGRVFNIGNDEAISIHDLAKRVVEQLNPQAPIEFVPYEEAFGAGFEDIRHRVPDLSRIRTAIDYQPRYGLDDAIRDLADQHAAAHSAAVSAL